MRISHKLQRNLRYYDILDIVICTSTHVKLYEYYYENISNRKIYTNISIELVPSKSRTTSMREKWIDKYANEQTTM